MRRLQPRWFIAIGVTLCILAAIAAVPVASHLAGRSLLEAVGHVREGLAGKATLDHGAHAVDLMDRSFSLHDIALSGPAASLTAASLDGQGLSLDWRLEAVGIDHLVIADGVLEDPRGRRFSFAALHLFDIDPSAIGPLFRQGKPDPALLFEHRARLEAPILEMREMNLRAAEARLERGQTSSGEEVLTLSLDDARLIPGSLPLFGTLDTMGALSGDLTMELQRAPATPLARIRMDADLDGKGQAEIRLSLAGLPETASAASPAAIGPLHLTYRDGGLVEERMAATARANGEDRQALAGRLADRLARNLRARNGRLQDAANAFRQFLIDPGSITIETAPADPVPLLMLMTLALLSAENLAEMLDLRVDARNGRL
ncbi:MAG: hypothetical protein KDF64_20080 [Geminicoccaceae bacterium]|nr:hypothetical protein [Geminicoccaceae bacterium]